MCLSFCGGWALPPPQPLPNSLFHPPAQRQSTPRQARRAHTEIPRTVLSAYPAQQTRRRARCMAGPPGRDEEDTHPSCKNIFHAGNTCQHWRQVQPPVQNLHTDATAIYLTCLVQCVGSRCEVGGRCRCCATATPRRWRHVVGSKMDGHNPARHHQSVAYEFRLLVVTQNKVDGPVGAVRGWGAKRRRRPRGFARA